jgi:hypothetical protein
MRTISIALGLLLILPLPARSAFGKDQAPNLFISDGAALVQARDHYRAGDAVVVPIVQSLLANADKAMGDGPYSVAYKKLTLPGVDIHDYVSIAPYYWPNPATADHLPYVARDGQRNPEFSMYDSEPLMQLTDHVNVLSLAGYFSGDKKYSERAALLIRTWFCDPATRMNPNLNHCQVQKGTNEGFHSGIIESRRFIDIIDATELLRQAGSWSDEDDKSLKAWIGDYEKWFLTSDRALGDAAQKNNHGTWYDVQAISFALYLGDEATARKMLEAAKTKRIAVQIQPDGRQPMELARTRGFWYCEFNLGALARLAELGRKAGVDLWDYQTDDGRSLRKAVDWLIPYATGEEPWTYQQINGLSAKELLVPLRQAEAAWNTNDYEPAIAKLVGQNVRTDDDEEHPLRPRAILGLLYPVPSKR